MINGGQPRKASGRAPSALRWALAGLLALPLSGFEAVAGLVEGNDTVDSTLEIQSGAHESRRAVCRIIHSSISIQANSHCIAGCEGARDIRVKPGVIIVLNTDPGIAFDTQGENYGYFDKYDEKDGWYYYHMVGQSMNGVCPP